MRGFTVQPALGLPRISDHMPPSPLLSSRSAFLYSSLCRSLTGLLLISGSITLFAQPAPTSPSPKPNAKDEMRLPWERSETRFNRSWLVLGPFPGQLQDDILTSVGGEAGQSPSEGQKVKPADGPELSWHGTKAWGNTIALDQAASEERPSVAYAFTKVTREKAGKARVSVGSEDGIRVWVNGRLVLSRDALRSLTPDEDQVDVDFRAGENTLLVKVPCHRAPGLFTARILEVGTITPRLAEIGPSLLENGLNRFSVKTDIAPPKGAAAEVLVEVVGAGGKVLFTKKEQRGSVVAVNAEAWPDGPYEVRCSTQKANTLLYVQHLPWYKGNSLTKAAELLRVATASDAATPAGMTLRMLAEMVEDRLGSKLTEAKGNPWMKIHSPLMEFDELMLEQKGMQARARAHGFYRLAYRDEIDGSPQFCRAYLPANYSSSKKWPVVIQMHGYNPANPRYIRWWGADSRHAGNEAEYSGHEQVIYLETHGRGNADYLYLGDQDVVRALAEAKKQFSVDEDRVYLTGDSMGGWGTWNIGTRHPDLFAAIAPVFGGSDYHVYLTEEELAKLDPVSRFYQERRSTWATADSLLNLPIFVHHGDIDQSVRVDYSRWGVRLLQRWGYDIRYHEYPGFGHEALRGEGNAAVSMEWFLRHKRQAAPTHVRVRSADLRTAKAYWVQVEQMESPAAFMVVDAEVIDRRTIRLDTQNIQALTLTPSASLIDSSQAVQIVWNGRPVEARFAEGRLTLLAEGATLKGLVKRPSLPGTLVDLISTPFAIVIGTSATDPEMRALCEDKAKSYAEYWRDWQKQELRMFKDTEISEADLARYSLVLVGGPGENRVTARLLEKLPVSISPEGFVIDGKTFSASDAVLNLIYPHPLNPERYVRLIAPTSLTGFYYSGGSFANLNNLEPYLYDFTIQDARLMISESGTSPHQFRVLSGQFDSHWRLNDALLIRGDESLRAKGQALHRPQKDYRLDPALLAEYRGSYQFENGPKLVLEVEEGRLVTEVNGQRVPLSLETTTDFYLKEHDVHFSFTRDTNGKVAGMTANFNLHEIRGTKL